MKGAIGNAFIMNLVISFILIFYMMLIASMAYTKAYKVKNYLLDSAVYIDEILDTPIIPSAESIRAYRDYTNDYLREIGYNLSTKNNSCPKKDGYDNVINTSQGNYDYCLYYRVQELQADDVFIKKYNYMVLSYMKFDFPVVGDFIKIPITGESKTILRIGD